MSDLIDTTEMYLKAILEIVEIGKQPKRSALAQRLDQAMPTVSQTVERMTREGLVFLDDDRVVNFTEEGLSLATSVMRKHRIAEVYLFEELGFAWADCHEEACRWEHVISDEAELKMAQKLGDIGFDPFGNVIPGLDLIGLLPAAGQNWPTISDLDFTGSSSRLATLKSISEPIQANPAELQQLFELAIVPGAEIEITQTEHHLTLRSTKKQDSLQLDRNLSEYITVEPQ